jgi:glycosyltransferase involved in cell wall biosynthesis
VFVANGELEGQIKARAAPIENVHFMSFKNQSLMPAVYRLGDIFVLPSKGPEETWGLALNEAMASGRAVIASTKVGGARDLIIEDENGWTFESGNPHALDRVLRRAIAAAGRSARHGWICAAVSARGATKESVPHSAAAFVSCPTHYDTAA